MRAEQIIASIMVEMAGKDLQVGFIKDISQRLYDYKKQGRDISGIALQRIPSGFYSQTVEEFVGRLLIAGLAKQEGPVILTPEGFKWLKKFIDEVPLTLEELERAHGDCIAHPYDKKIIYKETDMEFCVQSKESYGDWFTLAYLKDHHLKWHGHFDDLRKLFYLEKKCTGD